MNQGFHAIRGITLIDAASHTTPNLRFLKGTGIRLHRLRATSTTFPIWFWGLGIPFVVLETRW